MASKDGAWGAPSQPVENPFSSPPPPPPPVSNSFALKPADVHVDVQPTRGQALSSYNPPQANPSTPERPPGSADLANNPQATTKVPLLLRGTLPLGKAFGIPIKWHISFPLLVLFEGLYGFSVLKNNKYGCLMLLLYGPILWITVLVHELGHALTARSLGVPPEEIFIWPLGGLKFISHAPSAKKDIIIAFAGPLTHIPMAIFWILILDLTVNEWRVSENGSISRDPGSYSFGTDLAAGGLAMQCLLFVFNLVIPSYPLDGGRVFVDFMCLIGVPMKSAGWASGVISGAMGLGMCVYGVVMSIMYGSVMPTVLIGAWILREAYRVLQMLKKDELERHPMFAEYNA